MQYQIRIPPEVEKWVARLNAQAHGAWQNSPVISAPRWLLGQIGFWVAVPGLDAAYQRQLLALTRARRAVADVATSRKRLELQIGELERRADALGEPSSAAADHDHTAGGITEQLADLRRQYADMQTKEEHVTEASRRLMAEINAFRTGKEATKAAYTAAEEAAQALYAEAAHASER